MAWNRRNIVLFMAGGLFVFFFAVKWINVRHDIYDSLTVYAARSAIRLFESPWTRGEVDTIARPAAIFFEVPGRFRFGARIPFYDYGYALFLALLIPTPLPSLTRKMAHVVGGAIMVMGCVVLQVTAIYFKVVVERPGIDLPLENVVESAASLMVVFNSELGPTFFPVAYWLAVSPFIVHSRG